MATGRAFPLRSPSRDLPFDPMYPGETDRTAPLPFQVGVGAVQTIDTTLVITFLYQSSVSKAGDGDGDGDGGNWPGSDGYCDPITNQFCVPTGTIVRGSYPTGDMACTIT